MFIKRSTASIIAAVVFLMLKGNPLKADCPYIDETSVHEIYLAAQTIPNIQNRRAFSVRVPIGENPKIPLTVTVSGAMHQQPPYTYFGNFIGEVTLTKFDERKKQCWYKATIREQEIFTLLVSL